METIPLTLLAINIAIFLSIFVIIMCVAAIDSHNHHEHRLTNLIICESFIGTILLINTALLIGSIIKINYDPENLMAVLRILGF